MDIMEVLTPYARWDEYRHKLASRYREPVKIEMSNFHEVYPDLMQDIKIPDFFRNEVDFMEVRQRWLDFLEFWFLHEKQKCIQEAGS